MPRRLNRLAVAAIIAATAVLSGCAGAPSTVEVIDVEGAEQPGTATFIGNELVTSKIDLQITDSAVIAPGDPGNAYGEGPVLALWYETTNTAGEEVDPLTAWLTHMRAAQTAASGEVIELSLAEAPDATLLPTATEPIAPGETVRNAVAYLILDASALVDITVFDVFLNELGTRSYPVN